MAIRRIRHIGRARTADSTGRALRTLSLAVLLLAAVAGLKAQTLCAAKSSSKVATNRLHYLPSETVQVTGTGFSRSCRVALQVSPPEGSPTGDVPLTTGTAGTFSYSTLTRSFRLVVPVSSLQETPREGIQTTVTYSVSHSD